MTLMMGTFCNLIIIIIIIHYFLLMCRFWECILLTHNELSAYLSPLLKFPNVLYVRADSLQSSMLNR